MTVKMAGRRCGTDSLVFTAPLVRFLDLVAVLWNHGGGFYDKQTALRR